MMAFIHCLTIIYLFLYQTGYLLLIAVMLVVRTYCDIWMIQNGTVIERYLLTSYFKIFFLTFTRGGWSDSDTLLHIDVPE